MCPCAGHWPPSKLWAVVISTAPFTGCLGRSSHFWAASLADALAERLLFLRAGRNFPSSRYITGTLYIAIPVPLSLSFKIRGLSRLHLLHSVQSNNPVEVTLQKTVDCGLSLALCAVMGAASSHDDSPDRAAAIAARLAGALVDAVFELKEASHTFCVDVVGDGGATEADGVFQDFAQRHAQPLQLRPGELPGSPSWSNSGAKQALVGVDIANAGEQRLVEERCFDGQLSASKESGEFCGLNRQRLGSRAGEAIASGEVSKVQPSEAAGVNKANLSAACQRETRVSVRRQGAFGESHKQSPGHAEMNDPLSVCAAGFLLRRSCCGSASLNCAQLKHDVFSGAMDGEDGSPFEGFSLARGWCFEGFAMGAEPDVDDPITSDAGVDTTGNRFNLGQLGHRLIVLIFSSRLVYWIYAVPVRGCDLPRSSRCARLPWNRARRRACTDSSPTCRRLRSHLTRRRDR